jgi:sigma-E factor negative regulatory protein RseC
MAIEQGIVISVGSGGPGTARVKTVQSSACKSCSVRHSCNPGSGGKDHEVEAINVAGAEAGDLIQISMDTGALLKATFLLYVFPIICMLIGGTAGHFVGLQLSIDPSLLSAGVAIATFIAAMTFVRMRAGKMAMKIEYRPKITRIVSHGTQRKSTGSHPEACGHQAASHI